MSRAARLLDLIHVLRTHRRPVSGSILAAEMGVSLRTLYRDIATLRAQGADIGGAPGLGYLLKPGFLMPPMMLGQEEIEALVLGARWVAARTDADLKTAARSALAKIAAVLPPDLHREVERNALLVPPIKERQETATAADLPLLREAIRSGRKIDIEYRNGDGTQTIRRLWPFALGYFEEVRVLVAWCELRAAYRHFRTDRMTTLTMTDARSPRRPDVMLADWRRQNGLLTDTLRC